MIVWIVIGLGVAAALVIFNRERRAKDRDLGSVSNQWVTEHRLGHTHDTQR